MEIKGKDLLAWIHEVRRKNKKQRVKSGLSYIKWLTKIRKEAEITIGQKIHELEGIKR